MNFQALIRARYSVRAYKPDPVDEDKLACILEAARLAPTAANRQPVRVMVIPTKRREKELARVYSREWFAQAPLVLCVCAVPFSARGREGGGWERRGVGGHG